MQAALTAISYPGFVLQGHRALSVIGDLTSGFRVTLIETRRGSRCRLQFSIYSRCVIFTVDGASFLSAGLVSCLTDALH